MTQYRFAFHGPLAERRRHVALIATERGQFQVMYALRQMDT